jgi:hypothetical protein
VGRPQGKKPLGNSRRRQNGNIKLDLRGIRWGGMERITLAQDRDQWKALVDAVINLQVT